MDNGEILYCERRIWSGWRIGLGSYAEKVD
jgi:hypothetical protein